MSIVYLLHFLQPIGNLSNPRGQASHYLGFTKSLKRRLADHRSGNGFAIMAAVAKAGIGWEVTRTWSNGTRALERRLKRRHNAPKLCPICRAARKKENPT